MTRLSAGTGGRAGFSERILPKDEEAAKELMRARSRRFVLLTLMVHARAGV